MTHPMKDRLEPNVIEHLAETMEDMSGDRETMGALGAVACINLNSIAISLKRIADRLDTTAGGGGDTIHVTVHQP